MLLCFSSFNKSCRLPETTIKCNVMLPNINKKEAPSLANFFPPSHLFLDRTKQIHQDSRAMRIGFAELWIFCAAGEWVKHVLPEIRQWNITEVWTSGMKCHCFTSLCKGSLAGIHKAILRLSLIIHRYWNSRQLLFCWSLIRKYLLKGGAASLGWRIRVSQVSHPGAMTQRFEHFPVILIILAAFYPTSENGFCINLVAFANKYKIFYDSKAPCSKGRV